MNLGAITSAVYIEVRRLLAQYIYQPSGLTIKSLSHRSKYLGLFLFISLFTPNAHASGDYYWWNESGLNCLGPYSPGGPSFHTASLAGTIGLTLQESIVTNQSNPGWCINLLSLAPSGDPYYDEANPGYYPWVIPVHGQTGQGGGYRFFTDSIRTQDPGLSLKNDGPQCMSTPHPITIGTGNKFELIQDYASTPTNMGLFFERIYNSNGLYVAPAIGWGWNHNFSSRLTFSPSGKTALAIRRSGKIFVFRYLNGHFLPDADIPDTLTQLTDAIGATTGWRYHVAADDSVELYNAYGTLQTITDRAGHTQSLTYSDGSSGPKVDPSVKTIMHRV